MSEADSPPPAPLNEWVKITEDAESLDSSSGRGSEESVSYSSITPGEEDEQEEAIGTVTNSVCIADRDDSLQLLHAARLEPNGQRIHAIQGGDNHQSDVVAGRGGGQQRFTVLEAQMEHLHRVADDDDQSCETNVSDHSESSVMTDRLHCLSISFDLKLAQHKISVETEFEKLQGENVGFAQRIQNLGECLEQTEQALEAAIDKVDSRATQLEARLRALEDGLNKVQNTGLQSRTRAFEDITPRVPGFDISGVPKAPRSHMQQGGRSGQQQVVRMVSPPAFGVSGGVRNLNTLDEHIRHAAQNHFYESCPFCMDRFG